MLLGWTVTEFLYFGQVITSGFAYHGVAVAGNAVAALLMLGTAVLAIGYALRRAADPPAGG